MIRPGRHIYAGIFLMSLATLTLETLFTRIFSVTLWNHFAYMAISVAMLGLTLGASWVYFRPQDRDPLHLGRNLSRSATWFALLIPISLLIHLFLPLPDQNSWLGIPALVFEFAVLTLPFVFSGINITLALTSYRGHFHKLYAFDLLGAAVGCILFILVLEVFDPVNAVLVVGVLGLFCAWIYAFLEKDTRRRVSLLLLAGLVLVIGNLVFGWLSLGRGSAQLRGAAWDTFSRIGVADQNASWVLGIVLALTFLIYLAFVVLPIAMRFRQLSLKADGSYFAYFTLLGWGFMLVEMALLERLTDFIGNSNYGLTVVLCTILLATGAGSYLKGSSRRGPGTIRLLTLVLVLGVIGLLSPELTEWGADLSFVVRILVSVGLLLPMGILMGTAMPLGMAYAELERPGLTPWYWGMNGAASVFSSVLAVSLSASTSSQTAFWAGVACYGLAIFAFTGISRNSAS